MSSSNPSFTDQELKILLKTLFKVRSVIFDATEIKFDRISATKPNTGTPRWLGKRGSCPLLEDIEKSLALVRLHVNKEETVELYELMGCFDEPKSITPNTQRTE